MVTTMIYWINARNELVYTKDLLLGIQPSILTSPIIGGEFLALDLIIDKAKWIRNMLVNISSWSKQAKKQFSQRLVQLYCLFIFCIRVSLTTQCWTSCNNVNPNCFHSNVLLSCRVTWHHHSLVLVPHGLQKEAKLHSLLYNIRW